MPPPSLTTAVMVTRGDQDLDPIFKNWSEVGFGETIVWRNGNFVRRQGPTGALSKHGIQDLKVYGRYAAMEYATFETVFVQDDDCLIEPAAIHRLLLRYEPGVIHANMPIGRWSDYLDSCLVGWGAVFDRELPATAFARWDQFHGYRDEAFLRDCDLVFTGLTPCRKIDVGFQHLPWAETPGRLFKEPGHQHARNALMTLVREVRDA